MHRRSIALPLVALLAALTLLAGACGGDSKAEDSKKTTTTEKTGGKSKGSETTTTMSNKDFEAGLSKAQASIKDAGNDPCKLMEAFQSIGMSMGTPSNTDQRKGATLLALSFYRSIADAAPQELAAEAAVIRKTADKIEQEGKDSNWSEEFMKSPKSIEGDKSFETASTKLMTDISTKCGPKTGSDTPTGAPSTTAKP